MTLPSHIPLMPFSFGKSQQYDARTEKALTHLFHPILTRNPCRQISVVLDSTIDISECRTLIFSPLPSVEDVTEIQFRTSTTPSKECPYKDYSVAKNLLLPSCCSVANLLERNATKLCSLCTNHCSYTSLKMSSTAITDNKPRAEMLWFEPVLIENPWTNIANGFKKASLTSFQNLFCEGLWSILCRVLYSRADEMPLLLAVWNVFRVCVSNWRLAALADISIWFFGIYKVFALFMFDTVVAIIFY